MGPLGELGALFNPGMRREEEEKLSKEMLREEEGTGRKGRRRIDLDSGIVVIGDDEDAEYSADHDASPDGADKPDDDASSDRAPESDDDGSPDDAPESDDDADESKPTSKPGEPQVAKPLTSSVPSGKARRRAEGKARRSQ